MKDITSDHILNKMKAHLELTEDQIAKIEPMLKGYSDRINQNLKEHRTTMIDIMSEMEVDFAPILDESQLKRFKAKMAKKKKFFSHAKH